MHTFHSMGKTTEVAADRARDDAKTVLPAEVARGVYIAHPPSAQALKLMHLLIAQAGGRMAEDVQHELRLSGIRKNEGMRNHDRASLEILFSELSAATLIHDAKEKRRVTIGGLLDRAQIDYRDEGTTGDLLVTWWFGGAFRSMAEKSCHWAIMDRQTIFALRSKYSILLFQHIASLVNLKHTNSKTFTVPRITFNVWNIGRKIEAVFRPETKHHQSCNRGDQSAITPDPDGHVKQDRAHGCQRHDCLGDQS